MGGTESATTRASPALLLALIAVRDDRRRHFQVMARQPFTCALFHPPRILFFGAMAGLLDNVPSSQVPSVRSVRRFRGSASSLSLAGVGRRKARWASEGSPTQAMRLIPLYACHAAIQPLVLFCSVSVVFPRPSCLRAVNAGQGTDCMFCQRSQLWEPA